MTEVDRSYSVRAVARCSQCKRPLPLDRPQLQQTCADCGGLTEFAPAFWAQLLCDIDDRQSSFKRPDELDVDVELVSEPPDSSAHALELGEWLGPGAPSVQAVYAASDSPGQSPAPQPWRLTCGGKRPKEIRPLHMHHTVNKARHEELIAIAKTSRLWSKRVALHALAIALIFGHLSHLVSCVADTDPFFGLHAAIVCPRQCPDCDAPYRFHSFENERGFSSLRVRCTLADREVSRLEPAPDSEVETELFILWSIALWLAFGVALSLALSFIRNRRQRDRLPQLERRLAELERDLAALPLVAEAGPK